MKVRLVLFWPLLVCFCGCAMASLSADSTTEESTLEDNQFEQFERGMDKLNLRGGDVVRLEDTSFQLDATAPLANTVKPVGELSLQERADLSETMYKNLDEALSELSGINLAGIPELERLVGQALEHSKKGKAAALEAIEMIRQAIPVQEGKSTSHNRDLREDDSSSLQPEYRTTQNKKPSKNGRHRATAIPNGPHSHVHRKVSILKDAIQNGNTHVIREHMQSFERASMQRTSTQGSHGARRKLSKREMCDTLKDCASKMSMYDMFVYYKSDDIDDTTGEVDDNLVVFDDDDLKEKYEYIQKIVKTDQTLSGSECDNLLSQFHRAVEYEDVPKWEGATVSQVCLAEGTTMFVKLGHAAAASFTKPGPAPIVQSQDFLWTKIPGELSGVSVGSDKTVWGFNHVNHIYRYNGVADPMSKPWTLMPSLPDKKKVKWVDVGNKNHIWALATNTKMYKWNGYGWKLYGDGEALWLSVGEDGEVWHVGDNRKVYRQRPQGGWTEATSGARLDRIDVANLENIVGVSKGKVLKYNHKENTWTELPISRHHMIYASVTTDGKIWATDNLGYIYRWDPEGGETSEGKGEIPTPDTKLKQVSVLGNNHVLGVSFQNLFYEFKGVEKLDYFREVADRFLVLVETFAIEPLKCAEELFFTSTRQNDPRWARETYVFSSTGQKTQSLSDYQFPTGLDTTTSVRTKHGQVKGNTKQAFTFAKYTDLLQPYKHCVKEYRSVIDKLLPEVYADRTKSEENFHNLTDQFMLNITEDCIQKFFNPIQKGLELVFGEKPSPGFICGVKEAVVSGRKSMPGTCCLDAPFQLDGDSWGNPYNCDDECKTWGPYLAGSSIQACDAQGGTWCPAPNSNCGALKACIANELSWAKTSTPKRPAFEEYLSAAPEITDPKSHEHCGKAREYFGVTATFINDQQVCEDIHQLRFSQDFLFLDEFWNQGTDDELPGGGAGDDFDLGDVPPMTLTEPDLATLELEPIKNGQKWMATNFALQTTFQVLAFVYATLGDFVCPCDPTCIATAICDSILAGILTIAGILWFTFQRLVEISEFTFGQVAEVGNKEPIETHLRVSAVYDHVYETGKYLQQRFNAVNDGLEKLHDRIDDKLDNILKEVSRETPSRHLLGSTENEYRDHAVVSSPMTLQVEIVSHSPKKLLVYTTLAGGMEVKPEVLEVFALDFASERFVMVPDLGVAQLSNGTSLVTLPVTVTSQHVRVKVAADGNDENSERTALVAFEKAAE